MRGQANLEYTVLNWLLIVGLLLGLTVRIVPVANSTPAHSVVELFIDAYQAYYDSFYHLLSLPFP